MFVRNILQAGEFVCVVPVGLPVTLQYADSGAIQRVFIGHDKSTWRSGQDTDFLLQTLLRHEQIVNKISIKDGTTWIRGVLYTDNYFNKPGKLPQCIESDIFEAYRISPETFSFYAGDVQSLAATFRGAVSVRQWLTFSGFEVLPGYVVPAELSKPQFMQMLKHNYPFRFPLVASYIVFRRDGTTEYPSTKLYQLSVKACRTEYQEDGNIVVCVIDHNDTKRYFAYRDVARYNVKKGSHIVLDADKEIIYSSDGSSTGAVSTIECKFCGRQFPVSNSPKLKCPNSHCKSSAYPKVTKLLDALSLPSLTYERFMNLSDSGEYPVYQILTESDYSSMDLQVSLKTALRAIIPTDVLPNQQQVSELCDAVHGSKEALLYYVQHVDKLFTDLDLDIPAFRRLQSWLQDIDNVTDIIDFFELDNLHVVRDTQKFDGAPIFRDKTIMITGTFLHGDHSEIVRILSSYGATVVDKFSDMVQCVLIGDAQENINGHAVLSAAKHNIPVDHEGQFFARYDIDTDIQSHL